MNLPCEEKCHHYLHCLLNCYGYFEGEIPGLILSFENDCLNDYLNWVHHLETLRTLLAHLLWCFDQFES